MFSASLVRLIKFNIIFLLFISLFAFTQTTFAYDQEIAHPNIAKMAGETYNKEYNKSLSNEDIKFIMQGAYEEDVPIRWMNHFYDPVYNEGLLFLGKQYPSSKTWAVDSEDQSTYGMGDKSWYRAIEDYKNGDRAKALKALGHTIHLISDLGVPAHTRNDVHADEVSYEDFVKDNWQNIYNNLDKNFNIKEVDNLGQAFDELANYSNNNFYSKDTIVGGKYNNIEVTDFILVDSKIIAKHNDIFLYDVYGATDWNNKVYGSTILDSRSVEVFNNNAQHLIPKAVEYSAGVIKLFFDEVEKDTDVNLSSSRSKWFTTNKFIGSLVSGTISIKDVSVAYVNGLKYFEKGIDTVLAEGQTSIKSVMQETVNSLQDNLSKITFEQILTTLPNFIIANSTQTTNPDQSPPTSPPVKNLEEIFNTTDGSIKNVIKLIEPEIKEEKIELTSETNKEEESGFIFGVGGEQTSSDVDDVVDELIISNQEENEDNEVVTITEEVAEEIIEEEVVDNVAPEPPELNLFLVIATSTTSTMDIEWQSISEDVAYYNVEYKLDGADWEELVTSTTSTAQTIGVQNFKKYFVRVNAVDIDNNVSDWTEKSIISDWSKTVVINEIAWMGMSKSKSSAEWIELYNNTDETIDLSGWSLTVSGVKINWNNTSSTIAARSFYLLERTSDNTVFDIEADAIITISGGLNNNGEELILLDQSGEIIDQIDNSAGWFAGEKETAYKTMERVSPNVPGNWSSNWQTSDSIPYKGMAQGGARIYGSPKMPNKGYWYLLAPASLYDNDGDGVLTLTKENGPYIFDSATNIPSGFTLTVEPGVVLVGGSDEAKITVAGQLGVFGTDEEPVFITSRHDTNNFDCEFANLLFALDRDCSEILGSGENGAVAGDWSRITVTNGGNFTVDNVKFLYGGQEYYKNDGGIFNGKFPSRVIDNIDGEVNISNSLFNYNYINPDEDKRDYDAVVSTEIDDGFATTTINNVIFNGGHRAVVGRTRDLAVSISNSEFNNFTSKDGPLYFRYDLPEMENNIFSNNTINAIYLSELSISGEETLSTGIEYNITSLTVNVGATLNIEAGVTINMASRSNINVLGTININGIEGNPVKISPINSGENWGGIIFDNSTSTINFANLSGGGRGTVSNAQEGGMLILNDSNVALNNVALTNARRPYNMVYSRDSNLSITDSLISWDTPSSNNGWYIRGIVLDGGHLSLDNTYFNEMSGAVIGSNGATAEVANMTLNNFTNIEDNWSPIDLIILL